MSQNPAARKARPKGLCSHLRVKNMKKSVGGTTIRFEGKLNFCGIPMCICDCVMGQRLPRGLQQGHQSRVCSQFPLSV